MGITLLGFLPLIGHKGVHKAGNGEKHKVFRVEERLHA